MFLYVYLAIATWVTGGVFLDGWAHNNIPELETFFSPWHGVLYSGVLVMGVFLGVNALFNMRKGASWRRSLPEGYGLSFIGFLVFAGGGVFDLVWHELFGIEASIEALLSPSHLILAFGAVLMVSAPMRMWLKTGPQKNETYSQQLPMILSATFALSLVAFMTQFGSFAEVRAIGLMPSRVAIQNHMEAAAIGGFLFQTALLMGTIFLLIRRGTLAQGGLLTLFIINGLGMTLMKDELRLLPSMIIAGIFADSLLSAFPGKEHIGKFRFSAFLVPASLYLTYFITLILGEGIWWSVHLWTGSTVMAGVMGYLLSFLAVEPYSLRA
jgi:hypothetical protein